MVERRLAQWCCRLLVCAGVLVCSRDSHAIGVFLSGFGSSSSSSSDPTGTSVMANDFAYRIPGKTYFGRHKASNDAVNKIKAAKAANPDERVILVGHSYGGDSVIEVAKALAKERICVDLLIQIDSVGVGDEEKPSNVNTGVNIWSTSWWSLIWGASSVEGSTNIGVDNTTHTGIDDKDDAGTSSQEGYKGKNAYKIVQQFIEAVSEKAPESGLAALVPSDQCIADECSADEQDDFEVLEESLWGQLDEAGFCYEDGGAIEQYINDHDGLMNEVDAAWCDSPQLAALLLDFSEFVADNEGVFECEDGANARPFDDALHSVPAVSEWGLIVMTLLGLTAGTIVFGRRRRRAAA